MAVDLTLTSVASAPRLWQVVSDVVAHGDYFRATTTVHDPGQPGPGWCFEARTGFGRWAIPDRMVVTAWDPPTRFRLVKLGPVLRGWADVEVTGTAAGSRLRWREEIRPVGMPGRLQPIADRATDAYFRPVVARMVAAAEASPKRAEDPR